MRKILLGHKTDKKLFKKSVYERGKERIHKFLKMNAIRKRKSESHSSSVQLFVTPWTVVHEILQARKLEWVAFPFSRGSS